MKKSSFNLRGSLLLFTACTMASVTLHAARAQSDSTPVVIPGQGTSSSTSTEKIQAIQVHYKKLLLREKDIPNAVSHITHEEIAAEGQLGSVQSVLRQTPSVNEYQSGPGQGVPVLTIRGERLYELSETLDGIPISDFLNGGQGGFLDNNIGSPVTLDQLNDTTIYPGVAPPVDQGFGSGGGTIAYTTKNPSDARSAELFGGYGSFDTSHAGFELNSGSLDGTDTGAKILLRYDQGYTNGFIDNTNERYGDMLFKLDKPYNNGLSDVSLTVIYNRGFGYIDNQPIPTNLINQYGYTYNFPKSEVFNTEDNGYLTVIAHDETYVNPYLILSGSLFYNRTTETSLSYENPTTVGFNPNFPYQLNFQIAGVSIGNLGATAEANGVGGGYTPGFFTYDPFVSFAPAGSDPAYTGDAQGQNGYVYGEDADLTNTVTNTIGFAPKANIFLPYNSISIGALIAKENSGGDAFTWGNPDVPQDKGYNSIALGGGEQRSIYQAYVQDKIDLLNNTLHFQPGVTVASAYSSVVPGLSFTGSGVKLENFNVIAEPYLGVSYDLPYHLTAYASTGKGGYFAPISTYYPIEEDVGTPPTLAVTGLSAPRPEIIHLYEAGLRYDTSRLLVDGDFFYQKVDDADSYFAYYDVDHVQFDTGNQGKQQFRGYELDTKFQATPNIDFFGNASYDQANYLSSYFATDTPFEDQYGYVFKGDPLVSVPNWLANFGFDLHYGNFGARLDEEYTGAQYITYDLPPVLPSQQIPPTGPIIPNITPNPLCTDNSCLGLATVPDSPNALKTALGGPVPNIKQPGFLISNLLLTYDLPLEHMPVKSLHFELNMQNFLNVHYVSHLYSSYAEYFDSSTPSGYAETSAYQSEFVGPPRSFTVELAAKF